MLSHKSGVICSIVKLTDYKSFLLDPKFCENCLVHHWIISSSYRVEDMKRVFKCLVNEQIIEFNQDDILRTCKYQCCITHVTLILSFISRRWIGFIVLNFFPWGSECVMSKMWKFSKTKGKLYFLLLCWWKKAYLLRELGIRQLEKTWMSWTNSLFPGFWGFDLLTESRVLD